MESEWGPTDVRRGRRREYRLVLRRRMRMVVTVLERRKRWWAVQLLLQLARQSWIRRSGLRQ